MDDWLDTDDCIELRLFEEAIIVVVIIEFGLVEVVVEVKAEVEMVVNATINEAYINYKKLSKKVK